MSVDGAFMMTSRTNEMGTRGKPWCPARPELRFSLSHSGAYALCGVAGEEIGVDIETIRPRQTILLKKGLSPGERAWLLNRGERWADFYTLWTLKEARVKQAGTGLDRPARSIAVPLLEPGQEAELDGLRFTAYGGEDWCGALCALGQTAPLEWF